jgi:hypothetical protein
MVIPGYYFLFFLFETADKLVKIHHFYFCFLSFSRLTCIYIEELKAEDEEVEEKKRNENRCIYRVTKYKPRMREVNLCKTYFYSNIRFYSY